MKDKLMKSYLESLKADDTVICENGRTMQYVGRSSDGHSFQFKIEGVAGIKVFSDKGVGAAVPAGLTIDLQASLDQRVTTPKVKVAKTLGELVDNVYHKDIYPFLWLLKSGLVTEKTTFVGSGLDTEGKPRMFRYQFTGFHDNNPTLKVLGLNTKTGYFQKSSPSTIFSWDGKYEPSAHYKHGHKKWVSFQENLSSLPLEFYKETVKVDDTFSTISGHAIRVLKVSENSFTGVSLSKATYEYDFYGNPLDPKNVSMALRFRRKPKNFVIPTPAFANIKNMAAAISPNIVVTPAAKKEQAKPAVEKKVAAPATTRPTAEDVIPGVRAPILTGFMQYLRDALESFAGPAEKQDLHVIVNERGEILDATWDAENAPFRCTKFANERPGTKVLLLNLSMVGFSEVPKPEAKFTLVK